MSVTSGPNASDLFAILIPTASSAKTFRAFCPVGTSPDVHTLAYVAGLVDGDGSIWIQKGRTTQVYPALTIRLGWKGEETLRWLQRTFGGGFGKENRAPNPKHSEVFWWTVRGKDAASVLAMIYPYLRVKTAQAATALHCWSLWQTEPRESRFLTCLRLKELMGVLNRTGEKIALPVVGRWLLVPTVQHGATRSLVFLKTWPKSGVMSNGVCWQRPTWVPRTDASASSLWPTPLSQEAKHGAATDYELRHDHPANVSSLRVVVAKWATPTVDDANNVTLASGQMQSLARDTNLWATPRAEDGERGQGSKSDGLSEDVTAWATPTTRDYKDTGDLSGSAFRQDGTPRDDTAPSQAQAWAGPTPPPSEAPTAPTDSSQPKPRRRGLNPRFGLWLMGLPTDWLDLPSGPSLPANQVESQSSER